MSASEPLTDYSFVVKRSSDEGLEQLRGQHEKAAEKAFDAWCMHERIVIAIMHEQTERMVEKDSSHG